MMENRTLSALPLLSKESKTSNAGDAEEIGSLSEVRCLGFFLQVKLLCLNQFK